MRVNFILRALLSAFKSLFNSKTLQNSHVYIFKLLLVSFVTLNSPMLKAQTNAQTNAQTKKDQANDQKPVEANEETSSVDEVDVLAEESEVIDQLERLNKISENSLDFKTFIYSERGRRNPFQKPGGIDLSPTVSGDILEPETTGLEGYDLSSFQLTAVMWDIKYPKALVKAAEKEVYVIEEGTKIGRRNGYVAKIREGEVVVIEPNVQSGKKKATLYKTQVLKLGR